jgi:hypothetical protein
MLFSFASCVHSLRCSFSSFKIDLTSVANFFPLILWPFRSALHNVSLPLLRQDTETLMHLMYQDLLQDRFASFVMLFVMFLQHAVLCYLDLNPLIWKFFALLFQFFSDDLRLHFSFPVTLPLFLAYPAGLLKKALLLLSELQFLILGLHLSALQSFSTIYMTTIFTYC